MSRITRNRVSAGLALAVAATFALSACAMGGTADPTEEPAAPMETEMPMETEEPMAMDPAANLLGPGCAAYADAVPTGGGSIEGMSTEPVAIAASNNPLLTTLVAAVSGQLNPGVDLVDTLNGGQFTVFAPVDDAFAAVDPATIETLSTDADLLSAVLTYHVLPGQIEPADIAGTHTTVQGADLEVTGSGDSFMVNGANVICGGVQTANAVVYLVDAVLLPPAE